MYFNGWEDKRIIIIFPLEDYRKMNEIDKLKFGVIYVKNVDKSILENEENVFTYIPPIVVHAEYVVPPEMLEKKKQIQKEIDEYLEKKKNNADKK